MSTAPLYRESSGDGALPLVCLHGWGLNLRVFDGLRARLAPHAFIGVDLPGHGASSWIAGQETFEAQVTRLLDALPERCNLLGWSLGGQLAIEVAHSAPQRVQHLVLVATTPRFAADAHWPQGMAAPVLERFAAQLQQDARATLREFLQLQVRGSRDVAAALAQLEAALLAHGEAQPPALAAGLGILRQLDLRGRLPELAASTLVISGQHDRITPPLAGRYLAAQIKGARYVELPRAGHAPFLSHEEDVAQLLRDFLQQP